jgi:hypothetical protein
MEVLNILTSTINNRSAIYDRLKRKNKYINLPLDNYKDTHIIAGLYLIPQHRVSSLLKIEDNTRLEDARLFLKNNGIPESCHIDLISKFGFDIIFQTDSMNNDRRVTMEDRYINAVIRGSKDLEANQLQELKYM